MTTQTEQVKEQKIRVIRQARLPDLERLLPLGEMFYTEAGLVGKFNPESFIHSWTMVLTGNMGVIFILEEDSMIIAGIGGVRFPESASRRINRATVPEAATGVSG